MKTLKSRLLLVGTLLALVIIGTIAKAEETKAPSVKETVTAIGEGIQQAPAKISGWAQSEWTDIKEFQAASWADAKAQNKANWEKLKGLFNTTKSTN